MFDVRKLNVGARLAAGFGALLVLIVVILAVVLTGNSRTSAQFTRVVDVNMHKMQLLNSMLDTTNDVLLQRRLLLLKRGEDLATDYAQIQTLTAQYDALWSEFQQLPRNARGDEYVKQIQQARAANDAAGVKVDAAMHAMDFDSAAAIQMGEMRPLAVAWKDLISEYTAYQGVITDEAAVDYRQTETITNWLAIGVGLLSMLLGSVIAWVITRSLTVPLAAATRAAQALANGDLDIAMPKASSDEVGQVGLAIANTRQAVVRLRDGLTEMTRQHEAGIVSYCADTSALSGDYRRLGDAINALLQEHVGAAMLAGRLADRYARGDLSEDFPRVPGEKAQLMDALDNVKRTIGAINTEILQLSQSATRGDFSLRGDESRFEFGFRQMVANLNGLMATADGSLGSLSQMLRSIAQGDLTVHMDGDYQGVFATMRDDANATVAQLRQIVGGIQGAAGSINLAAGEIAQGNAELSRRTEQQAANLEETAASMEELTSTVRQNAEHARQANQLTISAQHVASEGGQATSEVVTTMGQIEQSSRRIADIISVIDGIAFQTNILALNAAVEAARAGEQGRGFAVVASEVRTLAQRSADAAKEIKGLIEDSVGKVAIGSEQVRKAGQTMSQIVTSVQQVTDIMAEISAASQEQSAGIEQVNQTVVQMDEATQQNAALVEEASAAARAMEEQAQQLNASVAVFRLQGGVSAAPSAPPVATITASRTSAAQSVDAPAHKAPSRVAPPRKPAPALTSLADSDSDWQEF